MKKLAVLLSLYLAACASNDQPKLLADNSDIPNLTCEQIALESERTHMTVERLRKAKNLTHAGNALSVAATLLSFNPFLLADLRNPSDTIEEVKSFEDRLAQLEARKKTLQCAENG